MKKLWILIVMLMLSACATNESQKKVMVGIIRVPNDTVIAIQNKWIEDEFEKLGLDVEFRFFDSGVAMNQAFASGALDIAEMGFTNGVVALSRNLPVELFWIHDVIGETEALITRDKNIQSVEDLKGKKIATIFSSTSHLSLLKTLEKHHMSPKDVTLLNMETAEIVAAWKRGDLDAAYTWEPTLSAIKDEGHVLVTSKDLADEGLMTTNIGLVHQEFAKDHEDALLKFIECLDKAYKLRKNDFDKVVSDAATYLGIDTNLTETQLKGSQWISKEDLVSDRFMSHDFIDIFYETSQFWYDQGFIDKPLDKDAIRAFVNTSYIEAVMDQ